VFIKEIALVFEAALPIIGGLLLETVIPLINIYFLSDETDPNYIAGLGLGSMWVTCLGTSLCYGLAAGLETLAA
jgi:Na+-driven multidrug efflux pump